MGFNGIAARIGRMYRLTESSLSLSPFPLFLPLYRARLREKDDADYWKEDMHVGRGQSAASLTRKSEVVHFFLFFFWSWCACYLLVFSSGKVVNRNVWTCFFETVSRLYTSIYVTEIRKYVKWKWNLG